MGRAMLIGFSAVAGMWAKPSLRILAASMLVAGGAGLPGRSLFLRKPATAGDGAKA
ncbi:hypothetical protein NKJ26_25885 [Mesorhizobium sp. M0152]|uniref:hypothetical protein n=1 Tax=Mesorhizobium sp. M0152 TaxID=2956898 RepID=UPI00333B4081